MVKNQRLIILLLAYILPLTACSAGVQKPETGGAGSMESNALEVLETEESASYTTVAETITSLEEGLSAVSFSGDDGFNAFLEAGGASSDADVLSFLTGHLLNVMDGLGLSIPGGGCSTISVPSADGEGYYFGRNFDWNRCDALILVSCPEDGYRSISTVNSDFIGRAVSVPLSGEALKTAALYAPMDGMNEMGLCVSVNMIQDSATIEQNTEKSGTPSGVPLRYQNCFSMSWCPTSTRMIILSPS